MVRESDSSLFASDYVIESQNLRGLAARFFTTVVKSWRLHNGWRSAKHFYRPVKLLSFHFL
jgi:hypothetical protein